MSYFFENETRKERIKKPSQRLFCAQAGKYELHTHNKNQKEKKKTNWRKKNQMKKAVPNIYFFVEMWSASR